MNTNIYLLLIFTICKAKCFEGDTINGRQIEPWTTYKYYETFESKSMIREYILKETSQRTYLMCPKGKS